MALAELSHYMHFEFTAEGMGFLFRALDACDKFGVTWYQLWAHEKGGEGARQAIGLDDVIDEAAPEAARLAGAAVVAQMFLNVANGDTTPSQAVRLLSHADLLTEENIDVVAEHYRVTSGQLLELFGSEETLT
jgi:hypothetical protein